MDEEVQAVPVPGVKDDNATNETSSRQSIKTQHPPKTETQDQKPKSVNRNIERENVFMENYMQNLAIGNNTLIYVFQYLKVEDLLKAVQTCTMWRDIGSNPILWRTVRMKNSKVYNFEKMMNALEKYHTVNLNLRKMSLPNNEIWTEFCKSIGRVQSLRKIEFCSCPAEVMEKLPLSNPNLEVISSVMIKSEKMNFNSFGNLNCVKELTIRAITRMTLNSIESLKKLKNLKILNLTSVIHLNRLELTVLAELTNLVSLDLGECTQFPASFGKDVLIKLEKLSKLRLEQGRDGCHIFEILDTVKDMMTLKQLELINFDIEEGFDKVIGLCKQLKQLMIIPTYETQRSITNNMVMASALRLRGSLTHFVWGVSLELIRVTELFLNEQDLLEDEPDIPPFREDSIPVLKPVPDFSQSEIIQPASDPPRIEILPVINVQEILRNSLPTTQVNIIKLVPHSAWRQSLQNNT